MQAAEHTSRRAFSLVELMVVIAVLGLLVTAITLIAGRTIYNQRKANTLAIMRNCTLAIEQFAQDDPLRAIYDRRDNPTFGPYPPYTLAGRNADDTVRNVLDGGETFNTLAARLHRDLGGGQGDVEDWVRLSGSDENDDARAFYIYLKVFSPGALSALPADRLKPLDPQGEFVNPKGTGGDPRRQPNPNRRQSDWFDVFAVHDAWDVPLDYMLYVRVRPNPAVEAYRRANAGIPDNVPTWLIVDRRPVFRSRGVKRDVYESWRASNASDPAGRNTALSPPEKWIFSEPLPQPWAQVSDEGQLSSPTEGWLRAVARGDDYKFRPDQDLP